MGTMLSWVVIVALGWCVGALIFGLLIWPMLVPPEE